MSTVDIIRAWKDVDYRLSLDAQQQAMLPKHPAGEIELLEVDLEEPLLCRTTGSIPPFVVRTNPDSA